MYIEVVPNRNSPPAILLRESYRENGKVRKRTLCNLSDWPTAHVEGLRGVLKGGTVIPADRDAFTILRSLPHGHVAAALGTARKIGLDRLLGPGSDRCRDLVLALLIGRILEPTSKLAAARALSPATASSSLGEALGLGEVDDDELYAALDWLHQRQPAIETILANRHLRDGTLVLYDVSSSYLEGRCCPLAQRGYSRDGKKGTLQIVYGLLCAPDGCPVAIEVFDGNTGDPSTLAPQIEKLKQRFGLTHVVLVGDRGMITEARITADIQSAGLDWISALGAPAIKDLLNSDAIQPGLFDQRDMAAITAPDYPGERLVVCRNPDLAAERARKREELLAATETDLAAIKARVERTRNPLRGTAEIALAVGAQHAQHEKAFRLGDHRHRVQLHPQDRRDCRRGGHRRALRRAHQPGRGDTGRCRYSTQLQIPGPGGARVPLRQDRRSACSAGVSLAGRSGAGACVSVHAGLLPRMAHASAPGADAVR